VINRLDLRGAPATDYRRLVPRADFDVAAAVLEIQPIVDDVRTRGSAAVRDIVARFDGIELDDVRVHPDRIAEAERALDPELRAALRESADRLREVCERELERETETDLGPGAVVRRRIVPIQRVGLYVPAGITPLPSTVLMNVVPAQVAGVPELAVASPPQRDNNGLPDAVILGLLGLLGIDEVYAVGGSAAVPMFAFGTADCRAVDLVCGPGNIYTVAAKRAVSSFVSIDSEAGPSEVLVLADDTADPAFVAADLISQAEHDTHAAAVLVTDSESLCERVVAELQTQVPAAKHADRIGAALAAGQSAIVLVDDIDQGVDVANAYAAEHLEIHVADADDVAGRIVAAGAVFVGPFAPVSLGDYCAGSNHVLPTGGCACRSSGLSVRTFTRTMQEIRYNRAGLAAVADAVGTLALTEDLPAHGEAVAIRLRSGE
jgi:histidinol dehydrogenase